METILAGDLPQSFEDEVGRSLADYTVAFIRPETADGDPDLLGTGVLVQVEGERAILTAHHVLELAERESQTGRLALLLAPTNHPHSVDKGGLDFLRIARGVRDAEGPDLGAAILAAPIASSIAAIKSFYDLTRHRQHALDAPPAIDDGVWVANGFLDERSRTVEVSGDRRVKGFYNFSAFGGPEAPLVVGEYDYYDYLVSAESRAGAPTSWGGMSGGGIWQVPLKRVDGDVTPAGLGLLSGILFYQHPTTPTQCGVRGHGRESIFRVAYDRILGL